MHSLYALSRINDYLLMALQPALTPAVARMWGKNGVAAEAEQAAPVGKY